MRLHILSEFQIEALEAHLAEFIVEDLILALQRKSSRILIGDEFVGPVQHENPQLKYHYSLELVRSSIVSAQFISEYLAKLGQQGIQGQESICATIRQEIAEIDHRAEEVEREKDHRRKLLMVLEHMGDTSYRRQRLTGSTSEVISGSDLEDNSAEAKAVRRKIVDLFGEHEALTNVEIRTKTGCGNDRLVIRAIKWLGERLILDRDRSTTELKIIRGKEYDRAEELLGA